MYERSARIHVPPALTFVQALRLHALAFTAAIVDAAVLRVVHIAGPARAPHIAVPVRAVARVAIRIGNPLELVLRGSSRKHKRRTRRWRARRFVGRVLRRVVGRIAGRRAGRKAGRIAGRIAGRRRSLPLALPVKCVEAKAASHPAAPWRPDRSRSRDRRLSFQTPTRVRPSGLLRAL